MEEHNYNRNLKISSLIEKLLKFSYVTLFCFLSLFYYVGCGGENTNSIPFSSNNDNNQIFFLKLQQPEIFIDNSYLDPMRDIDGYRFYIIPFGKTAYDNDVDIIPIGDQSNNLIEESKGFWTQEINISEMLKQLCVIDNTICSVKYDCSWNIVSKSINKNGEFTDSNFSNTIPFGSECWK